MPHPFKHDISWPVCPTCGGKGQISYEMAAEGKGQRGENCATCGGIGRVPDPSWPVCAHCGGKDPECHVCLGHGKLSPHREATLKAGGIGRPCPACGGSGFEVTKPKRSEEAAPARR